VPATTALPRPLAYACLALSMSLVGSYVALSKPLAAVFPVLLLAWLRFGIGGVAMLHWLRKPADEPPLTGRMRGLLFLESFLGNFLFTLCMISGVKLTTAVSAGVIMAAIPAAVAVLSWLFLRERVAPRVWVGVACAVVGIALLALAAAAGTESLIRLHPKRQANRLGLTWAYWALPAAISIITVVLLPGIPTQLLQVTVILLSGLLLIIAFFSLYATVESGQPGFRRARLWLDILSYGAALLLFLFVYQSRTRSLLSGTMVSLTAALLAVELLRSATNETRQVLMYSAVVGLLLGELTWALNYWPLLPGLTGGLLLLLAFYLAVGIALQGLQNRLTRRVLVEFALFGVMALALIIVFGPGF